MSGGGDVVCTGWLRKSPPEKKLRRYAWKKRWFILRSGRMSGDPDVLEYYKNDHSKKPLRIINLNFCEQVDAGLTFNKKELQDSFVFDIKTSERTFYLVAETEEDMNKWVQSICQICGFNQAEESTDSLRNISSASHGPRSSPAELSSSNQHLLRERKSSAPSHSSQPTLFTFEPSVLNHVQPALSTSAPQEYLYLHQCISRRAENARSASFSQGTRASFLMRSDTAVQKLAQGNGHCVNGVGGQVHGFYSLPKPSRHNTEFRDSTYDLPRSLASHGHTKGSLTGSETDHEDVYTFKTPSNTLCREFGDLLVDNMDVPATPLSAYQIPRTFTLDRNHNTMAVATPGDSAAAPPPRPPKPSQAETPRWGSPQQRPPVGDSSRSASAAATIPRRNTLPAMDNSRLHRGQSSSCESYDYPQRGGDNAGRSTESVSDAVSAFLPGKTVVGRSDSTNSEDNYVPMNPGSSTLLALERAGDNSQSVYIPMSPGPHHFDPLGYPTSALPVHRGSSRASEIQPPPVNRNLKPDRKAKPTPLDLRNNTVIDELPFKSPITKSWSRAIHSFNPGSTQYCRPISTQSITSTDSGDSEENYVPMQNPVSASPIPSGTNSPAPKKSTGSVDYLALDFQPSSPSPHRKPSTSSVTSDEKVDYVQVDKEKTQALQSTMQEWTDVRQSSEPSKGPKL
ncbi:GRB2-associated-binding protein 2 isoform X1 [Lagenorhynchus albirostris]|uniref:GRB2-associated-binding protein 2 isoform X1 n=1 Tax=Lagenorhynchus albirostris TaxID=27610 RepID=UPI0028E79D1A|nr:GRB2-associated-binding protein 2 isoform X1 [Lagenorhynchus albirostris]XP_060016107.1 GRB2-associated-binding protein 2 isoform X1 [Lagenorhynchus albirostris]